MMMSESAFIRRFITTTAAARRLTARRKFPCRECSADFLAQRASSTSLILQQRRRPRPRPRHNDQLIADTQRRTKSYYYYEDDKKKKSQMPAPLAEFRNAVLQFPATTSVDDIQTASIITQPLNLKIPTASKPRKPNSSINSRSNDHSIGGGGLLILGRNGTGKSLLARTLVEHYQYNQQQEQDSKRTPSEASPYLCQGTLETDQPWYSTTVAHVSFESHEQLLKAAPSSSSSQSKDNETSSDLSSSSSSSTAAPKKSRSKASMTAYKAITGSQGGLLTKAAQYLVVRFGLYPLLHRQVHTLSTGEIRKILLVQALAHRPRLLILDNAFDGLDVPSRKKLQVILRKLLQGFPPDLLVQGVSAKATAHTQVVLSTHRAEEIVDELQQVNVMYQGPDNQSTRIKSQMHTLHRQGRTGGELMELVEQIQQQHDDNQSQSAHVNDKLPFPTDEEIRAWWNQERQCSSIAKTKDTNEQTLVDIQNFTMAIPEDGEQDEEETAKILKLDNNTDTAAKKYLLQNIHWTVRSNEHWLVAGGNGAGKSTLSRLLAKHVEDSTLVQSGSRLNVLGQQQQKSALNHVGGASSSRRRDRVGWVSTELHMSTVAQAATVDGSSRTAWKVLTERDDSPDFVVSRQVAVWLGLLQDGEDASLSKVDDPNPSSMSMMHRPFGKLSQGEQKLVLIAAALAARPPLLVMDEPCQGLDTWNRTRVLSLCEAICHVVTKGPTTTASDGGDDTSSDSNSNDNGSATNTGMSLIYITHHHQEEVQQHLPSISRVIHLTGGTVAFEGSRSDYFDSPFSRHGDEEE